MKGLFGGDIQPFDQEHVDGDAVKKAGGGIYIVYKDDKPFYAGRSMSSVYDRLYRHSRNIGSKAIAAQNGNRLTFEYTNDVMSIEQVEHELIKHWGLYKKRGTGEDLSKRTKGNLANVLDPADKYPIE
jgi:predicted GIY-YIG superfamily endonuclease